MNRLFRKAQLAVRHAASKDETRYNMNGVLVEADGRTVASDGHMLVTVLPVVGPIEEYPPMQGIGDGVDEDLKPFILPLGEVKKLSDAIPTPTSAVQPILAHAVLDVIDTNGEKGKGRKFERATFGIQDGRDLSQVRRIRKVDGEFPDWAQVCPDGEPKATVHFDMKLLGRALQCMKEFQEGGGSPSICVRFDVFGPEQPCRITYTLPEHGTMTAIVMPLRHEVELDPGVVERGVATGKLQKKKRAAEQRRKKAADKKKAARK